VIFLVRKTLPPLQGLESFWRLAQGGARRLALPWAIIFRAFSPMELPSRPESDLLDSPKNKFRALKAGDEVLLSGVGFAGRGTWELQIGGFWV